MAVIELVEYRTEWPEEFEQLRQGLWPQVSDIAIRIEHLGSTAVPGLCSKPAIDLDILVREQDRLLRGVETSDRFRVFAPKASVVRGS